MSWNKYVSKPELLAQDPNLNQLIEPSFQRLNRLFVLALEDDQPVKNNKVTYENIRKMATGQGDFWIFTRNRKIFVNTIAQRGLVLKLFLVLKMTQCNSLNVKVSDSWINKLKFAIQNGSEVVLILSSNMIGDDENNFSHKLLLTNRQVANLRKAFANYLSTDIKLWKTQLSKFIQSGGFLGRLLDPSLKTGLPLIKYVIKPLAKRILIPLGLTAGSWSADTGIHKKS